MFDDKMTRRGVLALLPASLLGLAYFSRSRQPGETAGSQVDSQAGQRAMVDIFAELLNHRMTFVLGEKIGAAGIFPAYNDDAAIWADFSAYVADLSLVNSAANGAANKAIRAAISQQIKSDYEGGDVVSVDGWYLSRVEAHLLYMSLSYANWKKANKSLA